VSEANGSAFDMNAVLAEPTAKGKPFVFILGQHTYTFPPSMDFRASALFQQGEIAAAMRLLFGNDQWMTLLNDESFLLDLAGMLALAEQYAKHRGTSLGESRASAGSSKSTARPSKRTSKATTKKR
jgi:hypothetical protein